MGGSSLSDDDSSPKRSISEQFDEVFPYYLSIGMSYDQFWNDRPELTVAYRKADQYKIRRYNQEAWLLGVYVCNALNATVGNMLSKGKKKEYPSSPLPISVEDSRKQRDAENKIKVDKAKAGVMAFAQKFNSKIAAPAASPQEVVVDGNRN